MALVLERLWPLGIKFRNLTYIGIIKYSEAQLANSMCARLYSWWWSGSIEGWSAGRNSHDLTNIIEAIRYREVQLKVLSLPNCDSIEGLSFHNLITAIIVDLYKYIAQENREPIKMPQQQSIEIAKQENIRTTFSNMGLIQLIFKKPIFIKRHVAILNKKKVNCLYRTHDLIVVCRHIN